MAENRKLTWRHLKALNEIYVSGSTRAKIDSNHFIKHLLEQKKYINYKEGNHLIIIALKEFKQLYESEFQKDYDKYLTFLTDKNLDTSAHNTCDLEDLQTLVFISENKQELLKSLPSLNTFSALVFKRKGSKHLKNHNGLKRAVCRLLGIEKFPGEDLKENQWRFVVDSLNPKAIVLCENLDQLKASDEAKKYGIELWYVGGNNIGIIEDIAPSKFTLPIFYLCDWDYHGLRIYCQIYEKIQAKGVILRLLAPEDISKAQQVTSPNHKSKWRIGIPLSGLTKKYFSEQQIALIHELIESGLWIEEQTLNLFDILKAHGFFFKTA